MSLEFSHKVEGIESSGIRRFFELVIGAQDIISLGVGEPDFPTPWRVRQAAIRSIEKGQTSYTSNKGLDTLRNRISKYLASRFDAHYDPESELLITNGVSEAVDICLRSLINPGDEVILPEPNYVCYKPLIEVAGGTTISLDTSATNFVPSPEDIQRVVSKKTKALILCSPNNPTGTVIPKETLQAIATLAKENDFWVISDEIYAELTYDKEYTSLAAFHDIKDRTIILSGFSKAFAMTGWRLGYIAAPEALLTLALKIHQYSALCAPIMSQMAAETALLCEEEVETMKSSYQTRRNLLVNKVKKMGLTCAPANGAFYAFINISPTGLSSEDFAIEFLKEERVAVVPGNVFGKGGEGYVRCCYATDVDQLSEALKRMKRFVDKRTNA
jgi:aminotransferase